MHSIQISQRETHPIKLHPSCPHTASFLNGWFLCDDAKNVEVKSCVGIREWWVCWSGVYSHQVDLVYPRMTIRDDPFHLVIWILESNKLIYQHETFHFRFSMENKFKAQSIMSHFTSFDVTIHKMLGSFVVFQSKNDEVACTRGIWVNPPMSWSMKSWANHVHEETILDRVFTFFQPYRCQPKTHTLGCVLANPGGVQGLACPCFFYHITVCDSNSSIGMNIKYSIDLFKCPSG